METEYKIKGYTNLVYCATIESAESVRDFMTSKGFTGIEVKAYAPYTFYVIAKIQNGNHMRTNDDFQYLKGVAVGIRLVLFPNGTI